MSIIFSPLAETAITGTILQHPGTGHSHFLYALSVCVCLFVCLCVCVCVCVCVYVCVFTCLWNFRCHLDKIVILSPRRRLLIYKFSIQIEFDETWCTWNGLGGWWESMD